jgi:signal transduction histidine kinase
VPPGFRGDSARSWRPDIGLAVVVAIPQVVGTIFASHNQPERHHIDALGIALLLAGPTILAFRRRSQIGALAGVMAVTLIYFLLDYPPGPIFLSLLVALFTTVTAGYRRAALIAAATGYSAYVVGDLLIGGHTEHSLGAYAGGAAWLLFILAIAEAVRVSRERAREVAHANAEAERRRTSEERMRIAHDLHDVVAHNISLINVQAGVALHLLDERPEQARTALAAIKEASRDALKELQSTLDILRGTNDGAPRSPTPRLGDLPGLVSSAHTGGLDIRLQVDGEVRPLSAAVELAAYRIVQEALTNVRRHAGATTATVRLDYATASLTVQVDDDGRGRSPATTVGPDQLTAEQRADDRNAQGFGIRGMRERVSALGGDLSAGPRPGGGFRITARIPIAMPPTSEAPAPQRAGTRAGEAGTKERDGDAT